jgi:putative CocE/NonD family hydrolase
MHPLRRTPQAGRRFWALVFLWLSALQSAPAQQKTPAQPAHEGPGQAQPAPLFTYREFMVPMRDGVRLQTVVLTPLGVHGPLPILLRRRPYGVPDKAPAKMPDSIKDLAADGYIFVEQNLRGRFKSEGSFTLSEDFSVHAGGTIETRDAWDTVDWLVKHIPGNNGRVGIWGLSYGGYTAAATLLDPHPALKAVSEQGSPADEWMNDDFHRYGALRLSYDFEYAVMEEADKSTNTLFKFDQWDTYQWYLDSGPLPNLNARYLHDSIPFWNDTIKHPNYDAFWKSQAWVDGIHRSAVPNLNVVGFWDEEDPWGPWQIFRHAAQNDPDRTNLIVAGPWCHGCWREPESKTLGPIDLGHDTAKEFRKNIEAPFFAYWLHGKGPKPSWQATIFQTGSNRWKTYPVWPPKEAVATNIYLRADGTLTFQVPQNKDKGKYREYVSDPDNPVPYRQRPISPTYPGGDWPDWEFADQRFVDHRPDVLTFVSAPLDQDLEIAGEVAAELFAATSGTDSDFIVKLIDVFPEDIFKTDQPADSPGLEPGAYGKAINGYQLPIAMEVRRGRYLSSFEHPQALIPNRPTRWNIPLRDRDHVFLKGHRIMVQVQSSWFPVIDRNPQKYTESIYTAKSSDFIKATQRVYTSPELPSHIALPIMSARH